MLSHFRNCTIFPFSIISPSIKVKFLTEEEKAFGWIQNFSKNRRNSKFLQTNLHCLPEHLWKDLREFKDGSLLVGYKVKSRKLPWIITDNQRKGEFIISDDQAKSLFGKQDVNEFLERQKEAQANG